MQAGWQYGKGLIYLGPIYMVVCRATDDDQKDLIIN